MQLRLSAMRKQGKANGPITQVTNYQGNGFVARIKDESEPVRVIQQGDLEGHSPVCAFVDSKGALDWVEQENIQVIDPNLLPPSAEAFRNIAQR